MLWLLILVALMVAVFLYNNKLHKYWDKKNVKQTSSFPLFVDNFDMFFKRSHFNEVLSTIYNKFPDLRYIGLHQFTIPILMLRDPQLIKQINVKDFEHFLDHRSYLPGDTDNMWNKNLLSLKGQRWKDMRSTLSPSFTGSKMRHIFVLMNECAENFLSFFVANSEEVQEVELKDIFTRYTNDIIATTAFGIHCDSLKDRENEFFIRGRQTVDLTGIWRNIKFMLTMMVPPLAKIFEVSMFDQDATTFFRKVIKETLEYREKNKIERPDMLNLLMHARKGTQVEDEQEKIEESNFAAVEEHLEVKHRKGKMDLSLDDITSQALIFFLGGFETVSTAMCFMGYELALHPDIQQKLIEELDEFRASNKQLLYEDLARLPYLDMIVAETLRKWPPNIAVDRVCVKPYTIQPENAEERPVHLTENDSIWIPIWAIHHDTKYWEEPEKFDPERFSTENRQKIIPYTYLPFGVGPRNCIGSRFALIELKAVFYAILSKFEIVPIRKSTIPFVPNKRSFNFVADKGFWFGLKKRRTSEN